LALNNFGLPAVAASIFVAIYGGSAGIKPFLSRLLLWQCSALWAAPVLSGLPLVFVVGDTGGPVRDACFRPDRGVWLAGRDPTAFPAPLLPLWRWQRSRDCLCDLRKV